MEIDCTELTGDEQLALAGEITGALGGKAIALPKGRKIAFDTVSGPAPDERAVEAAVADFLARRNDASHYSFEVEGDTIIVRSPDPLAASHSRGVERLPPNLMKCPFCGFVTQYEELYVVHYRSHGFVG
ncbi:MAG TPA: hypothetical protein VKF39_04440 [Nitrososphaerales archaeon]|nr:hypothetical protein [Nitrososphaerales archaeon]